MKEIKIEDVKEKTKEKTDEYREYQKKMMADCIDDALAVRNECANAIRDDFSRDSLVKLLNGGMTDLVAAMFTARVSPRHYWMQGRALDDWVQEREAEQPEAEGQTTPPLMMLRADKRWHESTGKPHLFVTDLGNGVVIFCDLRESNNDKIFYGFKEQDGQRSYIDVDTYNIVIEWKQRISEIGCEHHDIETYESKK